jgi:hypothetical protein
MEIRFFDDLASRDAYYAQHPEELAQGTFCSVLHAPSWIGYDTYGWMADGVRAQWFGSWVSFGLP